MKTLSFLLVLFVCMFSNINKAHASHAMGADIGYTYIGGDSFLVHLNFYRDCTGIPAPVSATLDVFPIGSCSTSPFIITLNKVSNTGIDVTPVCSLASSECSIVNNQIILPFGVEYYKYEGIFVAPPLSSCKSFKLSYVVNYRNTSITNIVSPGSLALKVESIIDRNIFPGNSSPISYNIPPFYGIAGQMNYFDFSATDPDGDSLTYTLYHPKSSGSLSFVNGLDHNNPVVTNTPIQFDSITGLLSVIPDGAQVVILGVRIDKYRNGTMVGSVDKDVQITIMNSSSSNPPPVITGIDSTTNFTLFAHPGDTIAFDIYSYDVDTIQSIILEWNTGIPSSNFTITNSGSGKKGEFYWIVDSSHVQFKPHIFGLFATDDGCPLQTTTTQFYKIYVLNPDTTHVWPGDTDNDKDVSVYDLLPLGIAYGTAGIPRPSVSTSWAAQLSYNWSRSFINTLNYKFADANGDGIVDSLDLAAIVQNFGMTHPRVGVFTGADSGDIYLKIQDDTLFFGDTVTAEVYLGSISKPVSDLYGIAGNLLLDNNIIEPGTIEFTPDSSWFGDPKSSGLIYISKEVNMSLHFAISRTNKINGSGYGKIGTVKFLITANPVTNNKVSFGFFNIKAIDVNENEKLLNSGFESVVVSAKPTGIPVHNAPVIKIYPNPAKDILKVETEAGQFNELTFFDITGKLIRESNIEKGKSTISVKDLPAGVYVLTLKGEGGSISKKVIVE